MGSTWARHCVAAHCATSQSAQFVEEWDTTYLHSTVNAPCTKPPARPEKETLNFSRRTLVKRNQRAAAESGTSRSSRMSKAMRTTTCAVPVHNTSTSSSFSPVQTATERTNSSNKSNSATVSKRLMSMRHHRQSSKQTKIKPDGVLVNHSLLLINEMFTLF